MLTIFIFVGFIFLPLSRFLERKLGKELPSSGGFGMDFDFDQTLIFWRYFLFSLERKLGKELPSRVVLVWILILIKR